MSFYTISQYLRYRWHAKTRHGVHSPFVYAFIEQVLQNKAAVPEGFPPNVHGSAALLPLRYQRLLHLTNNYCHPDGIWIFDTTDADKFADKHLPAMKSNEVAVLTNIHTTPANTATWNHVYRDKTVKLSIDLHGIGILFFSEEIKEQQHFVLKY